MVQHVPGLCKGPQRLKGDKRSISVCFPKGVILSAVVSTDPEKPPFLLILDAKSFTELARASVAVDMHLDLHGLFIPDPDWAAKNQPAASEAQQGPGSDCQGPLRPDGADGLGLP